MGGGDNFMCQVPPFGMGYILPPPPPYLPYLPSLPRQNVILGGIIPPIAQKKFLGKSCRFWYLLNMKESIKRLLKESLKDQLITSYKSELDDLFSNHEDIIKRYKELTLLIDKLEYLDNIKYTVTSLTNPRGVQNYNVKVKDPYAEGTKWINLHGGRKDIIDKMSPKERESHFYNRALSYLMKKI